MRILIYLVLLSGLLTTNVIAQNQGVSNQQYAFTTDLQYLQNTLDLPMRAVIVNTSITQAEHCTTVHVQYLNSRGQLDELRLVKGAFSLYFEAINFDEYPIKELSHNEWFVFELPHTDLGRLICEHNDKGGFHFTTDSKHNSLNVSTCTLAYNNEK